ncbi:MAG TPA: glycogen synthase [Accumulibacter sp.]|uniref:glycogen synthase n=2 Tax=Accumulibacter sp. TaxID=2053492 RepID=UPI002629B7A1|nr:glycogen synthase [Accumulibacter sp.]MDS4056756.1 glycogen synthase [Accumulibacter sp.]HMW64273.1 glycogen synthase [Accumulibacter sp.]HMW80233.1 glycogen synthase [Accumulibacter sp.]HNB67296.1 glycogen synthase [Accumulibacter sp.]HNC25834.1 glycogen synthase [Accumulibacter sp.]
MKVLLLTREYPPYVYGGAGVHVEYLAGELAKLMHVEVRCFGDQDTVNDGVRVKGFPFGKGSFAHVDRKLSGALDTFESNLETLSEQVDADLVHVHTWYAHLGGILAKTLYGIPLVHTVHSLEPLRPWKREQLGCGYDMSSWIERTSLGMADAVVAVSEGTKKDILEHFDIDPGKISVIYNGINVDQYHPTPDSEALEKYHIDPDRPYVLFVGRITRQKGIIHLVNAVKYINPDAQVVLCAGAPDTREILAEMESAVKHVRQQGFKNIIWIQEMVSKAEAIQLYSHARVFCCPSIYEPFGIINLEAMACRTAVVASAVGGIKEVVIDGVTGFLVPLEQLHVAPFEPVDPDTFSRDLAAAINKVLDDPQLCEAMAAAGQRRAREVFSWSSIAQQTKALYNSLV